MIFFANFAVRSENAVIILEFAFPFIIQLFQERLFYKSVNEYARMSNGTLSNAGQRLLGWSWRHFIMTDGQTRVSVLFNPETLLTLIKEHQTITDHNTNRHCRVLVYAFVGQPLSTQLYKYQRNMRWAFADKHVIFTYGNNMLFSEMKRSPLLWLEPLLEFCLPSAYIQISI